MTNDQWPQIKMFLDAILVLPAKCRPVFLDEHCEGDSGLRTELEAYLNLEDEVEEFIEKPLLDLVAGRSATHREGEQLGAYRLESVLARGGMGVVYLARRTDGRFLQEVAVKVLRRGFDTGEIVRRFRREQQILANLKHPHIARIIDGGSTDDGLPYYVMEYVVGTPIDLYCDEKKLTVDQRLQLFCSVCQSVHAAHQKLVVHCDLKPSNILVTAEGEPKLLDFGIATLLEPDGSSDTRTMQGWRFGTPAYASPEQRTGGTITTASDVYSLGVLLYRLLPGQTAEPENSETMTPPPPSTVFKEALMAGGLEEYRAERLCRPLRGDVDTIVLKAMHPEPARRYASAAALAEDLHRHLAHVPIAARPDTPRYHIDRFVRRHPLGVAGSLAVLLIICGFSFLLYWQLQKTEKQRDRAAALRDAYLELLEAIDPSSGEVSSESARNALDQALRTELGSDLEDRALLFDRMGRIYYRFDYLAEARRLLEESLRLRHRLPEADPVQVAASLNNLALVLMESGELSEGLAMLREALAIREQTGATDRASHLDTLNNLATALERNGKYEQAEQIYREILELKRTFHGESSLEFANGLNNLAQLLVQRNRITEAEPLLDRALTLQREILGSKHPEMAKTLINRAALLDAQGHYRDAIESYHQALAIRRLHYAKGHPAIARNLAGLAFSLLGSGAPDERAEAEALFRRALDIYLAKRGPDHPSTLVIQRNLAATLVARGRSDEGEPLAREALERSFAALPPDHWRIADARSVLGYCLLTQGDYEKAERLVVKSYPIIRDVKGEGSRYAQEARGRIVELYRRWGKQDEARRYE